MKSLLQTKEWAALRESQGWQVHAVDDISVLEKSLPFGKSFLYVPEITMGEIENIQTFIINIQKNINTKNTLFIRLDILDEKDAEITQKLTENGFIKSFEEIQPETRQIVEITGTDEEIMGSMKEKGRYNTRIAQKRGVAIEKSENIDEFYKIFQDTAKRDGFEIRPKEYFKKMLEILAPQGFAELLLARYNGKTIAAEIVTYYGETASYLYGASSSEDRNVMAPYLLHFESMRRARDKGCKYYDLLAVAPEGEEKHKYAGISRFKRQFGGRTVQLVGSWDYILKPVWYKLFKLAEKTRRH